MKVFAFILVLILGVSLSHVDNWNFESEKEGIKVYTSRVEGSDLKAFKGEMTIGLRWTNYWLLLWL